jgi:hypothetical protein
VRSRQLQEKEEEKEETQEEALTLSEAGRCPARG